MESGTRSLWPCNGPMRVSRLPLSTLRGAVYLLYTPFGSYTQMLKITPASERTSR